MSAIPKEGEVWYVSINGSELLDKCKVYQVGENVVHLLYPKDCWEAGIRFASNRVYKSSAVDFIERAES